MRFYWSFLLVLIAVARISVSGLAADAPAAAAPLPEKVQFNRDIRPILSDYCYTCHGPDKGNRKTELRFDREDSAKSDLGRYRAIVPGDPSHSEMYKRITSEDEAFRMPPVYSGRKLTSEQINAIKTWIEQGANWEKHWAFIPPQRPAPPTIKNADNATVLPILLNSFKMPLQGC